VGEVVDVGNAAERAASQGCRLILSTTARARSNAQRICSFVSANGSALARRAIKRRAPRLHDAPDRPVAPRAPFPFAVVNAESVLKAAELAVCLHVVAKRRAAGVNCVGDDRAHEAPSPLREARASLKNPRRRNVACVPCTALSGYAWPAVLMEKSLQEVSGYLDIATIGVVAE
jgi:hypothetical protein